MHGKVDTIGSVMYRNAYFDMISIRLEDCKADPELL